MDIDIENDPYFIPTVPRYKKNLFSDDLDETIGDRFFECKFFLQKMKLIFKLIFF